MKSKIWASEWLLIGFIITVIGFTLILIFRTTPYNFVKMIKWSDSNSIEYILASSARRLYPELSEAKSIEFSNLKNLGTDSKNVFEIYKLVTKIESAQLQSNDTILLDSEVQRKIRLKFVLESKNIGEINPEIYFEEKSFRKLLKEPSKLQRFLFSMYQLNSDNYILYIIDTKI